MNNEYIWLNDLSRQFLERDYLSKGEPPEERIDVISNAAEAILVKPGFATEFKNNFKKGWYSLSSPIWTNFGTDRGLPISCVTGDTWINTKIDGGKQAKNIVVGDEVLTHKGRYRKITDIKITQNRTEIYRLKVASRMTNLYLTNDHLVLTNLGWVRTDELNPSVHLVAINRVVELEEKQYSINLRLFAEYKYIEKDNRLFKSGSTNIPKHKRVEVVSYYASPFADVVLDKDLGWALGLWFAEGSLFTNDKKKPTGIRITTNNDDEKELAKKWQQIIMSKFGVNGSGKETIIIRHNKPCSWYNTNISSVVVGNLFASFGKGCKEKTIPQWIIDAPKEILSCFLDGILAGDGSIRKDGSIKITLSNPKLILQIYQIGLKLGLGMSLQMQEKAGKFATTRYVYTIVFRSDKLSVGRFTGKSAIPFMDGLSYAPIRVIEKTNKTEKVFDFTVEEDHSFSASGVILHNCYGSSMNDSMESILFNHAEVGMMTKNGGGTSAYFGNLRGRGAEIRNNGFSSGSVHFMGLFDNEITIISQGSSRRGNFAAYLPIDHKDINEFLTLRHEGNPIQDLSFGVCVPDYWMQAMIDGDAEKRKVWAKVLEARANTGYPYILFTDTANRDTVDVYKDKGMKITHSNLCCVAGDQRVVTDRGLLTAKELYEQGGALKVFDGEKTVSASEMKLISPNEYLYRIALKNGMIHKVTKCHKVQTDKGMIRADELKVGDKLAIQTKRGLFGQKTHDPEDYQYFRDHKHIPGWVWEANEKTQLDYVKGVCTRNVSFLRELQILLANLGIKTELCQKPGVCGGKRKYSLSRVINNNQFSKIVEIHRIAIKEPVYCCEVATEDHKWVCNGIITHNSEILLPDCEDESFVCDLSSMNVLHYDQWKNTNAVEILTYLLDAVMTEFIDKAKHIKFMERAVKFAQRHRALGIGWLGWHSLLQSKMIPFESFAAKTLNTQIAKTIKSQAYAASAKLAEEYGEPELLKGYGRRNTTLLAIAPTKSSAFIIGQVSEGIEPNRTNYYIKDLQKGKFTIKNSYLLELLKSKGCDNEVIWNSILKNSGSVQHLTCLTQNEKDVFKTFCEISPKEIIIQAAQRQKYIDQSQSLNLMIHPSIPIKDVNALIIEAWKLGVKSLYYQISVNAAQQFSRNVLACQNCES